MKPSLIRDAWQRLKTRVIGSIVQDCPLEMCACEACGHLQCTSAEWVQCGKRLATALYLRDGNRDALALLKQIHAREESARQSPRQAALTSSPPKAETPPCGSVASRPGIALPGSRPTTKRKQKSRPQVASPCL